jgi:replication factor A1
VVVTLWGPTAEGAGAALEAAAAGGAHPVVSISACRVSSYNGVSVSTLSRSLVTLEPEGVPEAAALRAWYDATGHAAAAAPVGEGMPSALK